MNLDMQEILNFAEGAKTRMEGESRGSYQYRGLADRWVPCGCKRDIPILHQNTKTLIAEVERLQAENAVLLDELANGGPFS